MSPSTIQDRELDLNEKQTVFERKRSRWWIWLVVVALILLAAFLLTRGAAKRESPTGSAAGRGASQAVPVLTATAQTMDIPVYVNALGSVTAFNTVTVRSRVDGQLLRVDYQEGQVVHRGDVLAEIDPAPFQVQVEQAQGQLAKDQAQLNNARIDQARYESLLQKDAIPKQQLDTQVATVAQLEGTIKADQAAIDNAKLQLMYSRIVAPIGGRIGLRLVDVGNMVHAADQNGLLVITQVQPITVIFTLPEDSLPPVLAKIHAGEKLPVDAFDRSGTTQIASGTLATADNEIDPSTGTLRLKAVFENQDDTLFPNQFVNARLLTDVKKNAITIPVVAVQKGPQGNYVYVIRKDQSAEVRIVTPGISNANVIAIDRGLSAGEIVVTDGMDKLREGTKVRVSRQENQGGNQSPRNRQAHSSHRASK